MFQRQYEYFGSRQSLTCIGLATISVKTGSRLGFRGTLVLNPEDALVLTVQCFTQNYQYGAGQAAETHQIQGNDSLKDSHSERWHGRTYEYLDWVGWQDIGLHTGIPGIVVMAEYKKTWTGCYDRPSSYLDQVWTSEYLNQVQWQDKRIPGIYVMAGHKHKHTWTLCDT